MSAQLFLGLDVSTTAAKALLIDGAGAVVASASTPLSLSTPRPLSSEPDPHEWWAGTATSIRQAQTEAGADVAGVAGIGLRGQMPGLVLLGEGGAALRPAFLWNAQRPAAQCDEI